MKTVVVLSLGSNCGNRNAQVSKAMTWLSSLLADVSSSPVYETPEAYGRGDLYMNAVVKGETPIPIEALNRLFKDYEYAHGRDCASRRKGEVPIDIDIVIAGDDILRPRDFNQQFFQIGYRQLS